MPSSSNSDGRCVSPIRDFIGANSRHAMEILGWSDSFVDLTAAVLPNIAAGASVESNFMSEIQAKGLIGSNRKLTKFGAKLAYIAEYDTQADPLQACDLVEDLALGNDSRILDMGCGAGQTLSRLKRFGLGECVGIDHDIESLAWGFRMRPRLGKNTVVFICATGEAMPFAENRFTHVLSRVALNYMHQARAIKEAVRVLEPGGILPFRVMNMGYYLKLLCKAPNMRRMAANLYKLGWGCVAALTGFQFLPQRKWAAKEIFAPFFKMRKLLHKAGCDVVHWKNHESFLDSPLQLP